MKQIFQIHADEDKRRVLSFIQAWAGILYITITDSAGRTLDQNAKMWPMLTDISKQILMKMVDGSRIKATPEQWKDYTTAIFHNEQLQAEGENGEVILIGRSTSIMNKKDFSEFIEFLFMFGASRGVVWTHKIPDEYQQYASKHQRRAA
jgi:AAA+ ATPase superfamily predicted ATPase